MGLCVELNGPPPDIVIQLPGGAKLSSMPSATQSLPNKMDPFQSVLQLAAPALGNVKTVFDIVDFLMSVVECQIAFMELFGALLLVTGNPAIAAMFPLETIVNTEDDEPIPGHAKDVDTGVPDVTRLLKCFLIMLCKALKLVGLIPQVSGAATVKDTMLTVIGLMDAVLGAINSLADQLSRIPVDTGDPDIDIHLSCARDNLQVELEHQLGPLAQLVPMMKLVDLIAKPLKQGLPASVVTLIEVIINLGIIPFPDDTAKQEFLDLVGNLEDGLPIEIPDFSDLSDLPAKIDEIKAVLSPPGGPDILGFIEQVQQLLSKIQECELPE